MFDDDDDDDDCGGGGDVLRLYLLQRGGENSKTQSQIKDKNIFRSHSLTTQLGMRESTVWDE